jgi:cation:H+ antiporter
MKLLARPGSTSGWSPRESRTEREGTGHDPRSGLAERGTKYRVAVVGFLLLVGSAVLLTAGTELFAEHASAAGRRFGVTALAVGLVLAGAEPEELVTAIFASARHLPGIAAGDAIGANVTMLTVVLGLAALARPLVLEGRVRTYALAASAAGVAAALALLGGRVGRFGGALLVVAYLAAVAAVWWRERRPPAFGEAAELEEPEKGSPAPQNDTRAAVLVVAGVAAMAVGGWLAVAGAERIGDSLGLRQSVVGLTFVALATTAELFALVWAAFRRGVEELALAGVLGSAVYNATATLGVAALVHPLRVSGLESQAWLAAALPAALVVYAVMFKRVGRIGGGLLVAIYGAYLAFTFAAA